MTYRAVNRKLHNHTGYAKKLQLHLNRNKGTGMMSGLERDICIIHRGCEQRYEIRPKGPHHIYHPYHTWMVSIPMEKKHAILRKCKAAIQDAYENFMKVVAQQEDQIFNAKLPSFKTGFRFSTCFFWCRPFKDGSIDLSEFGNICVCGAKTRRQLSLLDLVWKIYFQ